MKDRYSFSSRYERTKKSKKQNVILNVLIGVVFVGILAVGASILLGDDEPASKEQSNEEKSASMSDDNKKDDSDKQDSSSDQQEENKDDESSDENNEDSESVDMSEEEKKEDSESESNGEYKSHTDETAGPDGSWEPVGTKQEEHQNSFDTGSLDWEEKQRALQYATGLSPDEIEYWWIGNGGSSTTVKGVVSKAENGDEPFVVMLEWVDGQGWKPTSVERVPGAADEYR
ncbi:YrrS family protein [Pseudalkalibacillus sp. Hm43]|uniref:YrrS family protein n=1 Tax=Pseudalkalibacillus sp. Hm43 TaxID=3450742 RepID=UPI003F42148A